MRVEGLGFDRIGGICLEKKGEFFFWEPGDGNLLSSLGLADMIQGFFAH